MNKQTNEEYLGIPAINGSLGNKANVSKQLQSEGEVFLGHPHRFFAIMVYEHRPSTTGKTEIKLRPQRSRKQ